MAYTDPRVLFGQSLMQRPIDTRSAIGGLADVGTRLIGAMLAKPGIEQARKRQRMDDMLTRVNIAKALGGLRQQEQARQLRQSILGGQMLGSAAPPPTTWTEGDPEMVAKQPEMPQQAMTGGPLGRLSARERTQLALAGSSEFSDAYRKIFEDREKRSAAARKVLQDKSSRANTLRDDFVNATKSDFTILSYAQNGLNAGDNQIGDVTTLYAYIKAIDPDSVVREGELALTKPALLPGNIAELWASISTGKIRRLLPAQRDDIRRELIKLAGKAKKNFDYKSKLFGQRATRQEVDAADVVYDPYVALDPLPPLESVGSSGVGPLPLPETADEGDRGRWNNIIVVFRGGQWVNEQTGEAVQQ